MRLRENPVAAEAVAIQALAFLADNDERLGLFLSLTGLGPETVRQAAREPGFLLAVLDHIAQDEALLLSFAAASGLPPATIATARDRLAGSRAEGWRDG